MGGKIHLKLNICMKKIANKYSDRKMKRTLKRELKVFEIVKREAIGISMDTCTNRIPWGYKIYTNLGLVNTGSSYGYEALVLRGATLGMS